MIAEAESIVPVGVIAPNAVKMPAILGMFVQAENGVIGLGARPKRWRIATWLMQAGALSPRYPAKPALILL